MGEIFSVKKCPPVEIEARGSGDIARVDVEMDGKVVKAFDCSGQNARFRYQPDEKLAGDHIFFVKLEQKDGNHAWASPLWIHFE